jgi:hypothetical protein
MVIQEGDPLETHFLNVDLEIHSKSDLQALVTALGKKVFVLFVGRVRRTHRTHLELAKITRTADATIRGLCSLIETLPKPERDLWDDAQARDFNVGVQAGTQPHPAEFVIEAGTVKRVGQLGARIVYTIYVPDKTTQDPARSPTQAEQRPKNLPAP